jgi:hypothetical protein
MVKQSRAHVPCSKMLLLWWGFKKHYSRLFPQSQYFLKVNAHPLVQ